MFVAGLGKMPRFLTTVVDADDNDGSVSSASSTLALSATSLSPAPRDHRKDSGIGSLRLCHGLPQPGGGGSTYFTKNIIMLTQMKLEVALFVN